MSAITFSTRHKEVHVRGTERAYLGIVLGKLTHSFLDPISNREILLHAIPTDNDLASSDENNLLWAERFRAALAFGGLKLNVDGVLVDSFDLFLNTALSVGNDVLKMAASVHGQCEVNAFVRGKNRAWMADIIEKDNANLFRPGRGWEEVIELLRESDEDTVFMSYSSTGEITSRVYDYWLENIVEEKGLDTDDWEILHALESEWEELSEDKKWEYVDAWADFASAYGLELSPERWADDNFYFGDKMNAGKIMGILESKREIS